MNIDNDNIYLTGNLVDDQNETAEFIALMSQEEEEEISKEAAPEVLPILPLRNTVLFPGVVIPITAGRDKSIKLIEDANAEGKVIGNKLSEFLPAYWIKSEP